jgi:hypothetical protein
MNTEEGRLLLDEVRQMRKLLELLAEPAIAQRDAKLREKLREIVGSSPKKRQAVFLMDGSRTQKQIVEQTVIHKGELSTTVGKLDGAGLLAEEKKHPKLIISIPSNFFDSK